MADRGATNEERYDCVLDETVDLYVNMANNFSQDISRVLVDPMQNIFLAIVGLWVVIQGYRMIMAFISPVEVAKEFIFVCIAWILLSLQGPDFIHQIYNASLMVMGSGASVIMDTASTNNQAAGSFEPSGMAGMTGLVCYTEEAMQNVWGTAVTISTQTTLVNPLPLIYAFILIIPYVLVVIAYGSHVFVAIFRALFLATISPYLMMGFGFGFLREEAIAGLRTLLASFLILWAATVAVALLVYGVMELHERVNSDIMKAEDGISIFNASYLLILVLGWAGPSLLTEAVGIANSVTRSSLTNTSAGVMTAGIAGSVISLAQKASGPAGMALSKLGIDPGKAIGKHLGGKAVQSNVVTQKAADIVRRYNDFVYPKKGS